jgi:segregation and condensation protein B
MDTALEAEELTDVQRQEMKRIVEALLFAASEPLTLKKIHTIVKSYAEITPSLLKTLMEELAAEYREQRRAFKLEEIAGGYLLRTYPQYHTYLKQLFPDKNKDRLSQAALEVLTIIAHRNPITRAEIEAIRGVDCSNMIHTLMDRELIEITGRLEVPGRPSLYSVSKKFLAHFGFKS